jgi:hypothetical protein
VFYKGASGILIRGVGLRASHNLIHDCPRTGILVSDGSNNVTIEYNQTARRVVDHLHRQILDNPEKSQRYRHEDVGAALGIDPRKVRLSLAHAGGDWITVEVSAKDRAAIRTLAKKRVH